MSKLQHCFERRLSCMPMLLRRSGVALLSQPPGNENLRASALGGKRFEGDSSTSSNDARGVRLPTRSRPPPSAGLLGASCAPPTGRGDLHRLPRRRRAPPVSKRSSAAVGIVLGRGGDTADACGCLMGETWRAVQVGGVPLADHEKEKVVAVLAGQQMPWLHAARIWGELPNTRRWCQWRCLAAWSLLASDRGLWRGAQSGECVAGISCARRPSNSPRPHCAMRREKQMGRLVCVAAVGFV